MAILTQAQSQPIQATITAIGHFREGRYGQYSPCLFESPDLPEGGRIWKNLKPDEVSMLHKGQKVLMTQTNRNGKQTWDVIVSEEQATQEAIAKPKSQIVPKPEGIMTDDEKRSIAGYIGEMSSLYGFCWKEASRNLIEQGCNDAETHRAAASSLFIATQKRFHLA